jgi:hypothetical protein
MRKLLIYTVFAIILFSSCEKYYTPAIEKADGVIVVEAQITNDAAKNYVHLTTSRDFYSKDPVKPVAGAKVDLIESGGTVFSGIETGTGYFSIDALPEVGKNYKLRITNGRDIYESEMVTMPPLPTINNFHTSDMLKTIYKANLYNVPIAYAIGGREFYLDAPVTETLSNYRFYVRTILEWIYFPPQVAGPPPPPTYGWQSFYDNSRYNLAGTTKSSVTTAKIEEHPLLFLAYDAKSYLQNDTLTPNGWILIVDEYGTSKGSYNYHQKLNSQFAADGSLFDPIQTQIIGNITCKTNPSKIVFGYFDLNSYSQVRYYTTFSSPLSMVTLRKLENYPLIPEQGSMFAKPPPWWE